MVQGGVVLPAPFGPNNAPTSPGPTVSDSLRTAGMPRYPACRSLTASSGPPSTVVGAAGAGLAALGIVRCGSAGLGASEVGLDHRRVGPDLRGRALGDEVAEVKHHHVV